MASGVENRMALILPVFILERLTLETPTCSDSSFRLIFLLQFAARPAPDCGCGVVCVYARTNSEIILPILPMSTFPLNSNLAVKPLENMMNSSESGNISAKPGVWMEKYWILE